VNRYIYCFHNRTYMTFKRSVRHIYVLIFCLGAHHLVTRNRFYFGNTYIQKKIAILVRILVALFSYFSTVHFCNYSTYVFTASNNVLYDIHNIQMHTIKNITVNTVLENAVINLFLTSCEFNFLLSIFLAIFLVL
jgi:hypothetical protein